MKENFQPAERLATFVELLCSMKTSLFC